MVTQFFSDLHLRLRAFTGQYAKGTYEQLADLHDVKRMSYDSSKPTSCRSSTTMDASGKSS